MATFPLAARHRVRFRSPMEATSILDHGLAPTAAVLDLAFADYFVKLPPASAGSLLGMVQQDSVDLGASRVWFIDGQPAGVLLHAQRGWSARLAAMGVVPAARRHGLGAKMVEGWIDECRARGLRRLGLEVIGANTAARALYARCGFTVVQRLASWTRPADAPSDTASSTPSPLDPRALARLIAAQDTGGTLPWQIAAESIAPLGPPWTAWELDGAAVLVSALSAPTIFVRALTWEPGAGPGAVARLLRALAARHPGRTWRAPAFYPETWAPAFTAAGWLPGVIDQYQMEFIPRP